MKADYLCVIDERISRCWHNDKHDAFKDEFVYVVKVDNERRLMVIVNRSVDHPAAPTTHQYVRVHTYMSEMVIRPHTSFDEVGM